MDEQRPGSAESPHDKRDIPAPASVEHVAEESVVREHEVQEVDLRQISFFAGGLLLSILVSALALWWLLRVWVEQPLAFEMQILPAEVTPQPAPGPGVEPFPASERLATFGQAQQQLQSYGWVDQQAGIVRIPIERAMELLVERGLPARNVAPPPFDLETDPALDSSGGQGEEQAP
jgi:hypothetical protein